jgi:hypothetical protein
MTTRALLKKATRKVARRPDFDSGDLFQKNIQQSLFDLKLPLIGKFQMVEAMT